MRVKLQLVMCSDDGREETVTDVITLQKNHQRIKHLGLTLAKAKPLITTIQQRVLTQQVDAFLASHCACEACGALLKVKGSHTRTLRTLFGTFTLPSPGSTVVAVSATQRPHFVRSLPYSPPRSPQNSSAWRQNRRG